MRTVEHDALVKICNKIKDEEIKQFTLEEIENVPEYFWHVPASSSGIYHPEYALGEGGLARHTIAACIIAFDLFEIEDENLGMDQIEKDIIISALILHDTRKQGKAEDNIGHTVFEHPIIAANAIYEHAMLQKETKTARNYNKFDLENIKKANRETNISTICNCIKRHMGKWNVSDKSDVALDIPENFMDWFVHKCDYLASRKHIEIKFDELV